MKLKRYYGLICIIMLALTGFVGGTGEAKTPKKEPLVMGLLYPLTGGASEYGKRFIQAGIMAAEDINADGGVNGVPMQWIREDTAGDKAQVVAMYKKMAGNPAVGAISGPQRTDTSIVINGLASKYKLPFLSGSVTEWPTEPGPYSFHPLSPANWGFRHALQQLKNKKGCKTVALGYSYDSDYPVFLAKSLKPIIPEVGMELVAEEMWRTGDVDFSAQLTKIRVVEPDIMCLFGHEAEMAYLMRQARDRGINSQFVLTGLTVRMIELSKGAAKGAIEPMPWNPYSERLEVQAFVKRFEEKLGRFPDLYEAATYDVTFLIADAADRAGTNTDRKAIRDALEKTDGFMGMCGTYTFNKRHYNANPTFYLLMAEEKKLVLWQ
jgi:branched-chain amino acid transport system substrate-binding protein